MARPGATAALGKPGDGRGRPVSGSTKVGGIGLAPASTAGSQLRPSSNDRAACRVPIPVSPSARPNTTSSVPSGSTSPLGAKSSANGPGWSIRTGGDQAASDKLYAKMNPMTADDIAETICWIATLPPHLNINTIELMPVSQSFAGFTVNREA